MDQGRERRVFPRWEFASDVMCYLEGDRLDGQSRDMSAGGAFLRISAAASMPVGAVVGIVFRGLCPGRHSTFLFGRVVRVEEGPAPGVGLEWIKAVTHGTPAELADFLARTLKLEIAEIRESAGERGVRKSVHEFAKRGNEAPETPVPVERAPHREEPPQPIADAQYGLKVKAEEVERLDVRKLPIGVDRHGPPEIPAFRSLPPAPAALPGPGAMTTEIDRTQVGITTCLAATVTAGNTRRSVTIRRMGLAGAFVETPHCLMEGVTGVVLNFSITSREGPIPIDCVCRVAMVEDGRSGGPIGMELKVLEIRESGHQGVLARYLRYLQFRSLSHS